MTTEVVYEQLEDKGEVDMLRKQRVPKESITCPKCGKTFKALGRHKNVCTGVLIVHSPAWDVAVGDIMDGLEKLRKLFMDAQGASNIYKQDLDKLMEWKTRVGNLMKGIDIDK